MLRCRPRCVLATQAGRHSSEAASPRACMRRQDDKERRAAQARRSFVSPRTVRCEGTVSNCFGYRGFSPRSVHAPRQTVLDDACVRRECASAERLSESFRVLTIDLVRHNATCGTPASSHPRVRSRCPGQKGRVGHFDREPTDPHSSRLTVKSPIRARASRRRGNEDGLTGE